MASTSLAVTVAHAIAYLTRPLLLRASNETIGKLQLALESGLMTYYAPSWTPSDPFRGSGRRCMTLSPKTNPPRPIFVAARAANVEWSDWMAALGGLEFDLFVDPGRVSVRYNSRGADPLGQLVTIWSEDLAREAARVRAQAQRACAVPLSPMFEEALREEDEEDEDELFAMLADELAAPTFKTPQAGRFPRSALASRHSRSCSSSSGSSSSNSLFDDDSDSVSSVTTASSAATETSKLSRRERARLARVVIDSNKKEVTNYDGGKTTVLTGGVMLGAPKKPTLLKAAPQIILAPAPAFLPRQVALPCAPAPTPKMASPWIRQPYGPSSTCTWRVRA
ncbi:unnamed protein product [Peniophora sp. CBMAI 1063]|nr:unnamed protein product [Peniophora sp. CBMAI 1063]